jgi:hypothetical protein
MVAVLPPDLPLARIVEFLHAMVRNAPLYAARQDAPLHLVLDPSPLAVMLSLPLLHALRQGAPTAQLTVAAPRALQGLLEWAGLDLGFVTEDPPDATRLDLRLREGGLLEGFQPRAGPRSRPLWKQYLAAALDAGCRCTAFPDPPYLYHPSRISAGAAPGAAPSRDGGAMEDSGAGGGVVLAAEEAGMRGVLVGLLESLGVSHTPLPMGDWEERAEVLVAARVALSADLSITCLGTALGVRLVGLHPPGEDLAFYHPFRSPRTRVVPWLDAGTGEGVITDPAARGAGSIDALVDGVRAALSAG